MAELGADARAQLAALPARGVDWARLVGSRVAVVTGRPAAVLVLFGRLDDVPAQHDAPHVARDLDVLLVRRADTLNHHPGQVAFPGGRQDPQDSDLVAAALREAEEETGVDVAGIEVLGSLGALPLPVSNHLVTPVLAWWRQPSPVRAVDAGESAHVFRAPVADLLDPANRRTSVLPGTPYRGPAFCVSDHLVWGFTALVLDQLFDALRWTEPWDPEQTVTVRR